MVFFWSANYIVGKVALREFPPLLLSSIRVTIAGLVMLPLYIRRPDRSFKGARDAARLLGLGLLGVVLNQLSFVFGLGRTTVAHASFIVSIGPVLVLLIAAALKQETVTRPKIMGMLLAMAGIAALKAFQDNSNAAAATWLGDGF